jgi:hypothetical protein
MAPAARHPEIESEPAALIEPGHQALAVAANLTLATFHAFDE